MRTSYRKLREENNLSINEVAKKLDLKPQTLRKIETFIRRPSLPILIKMSEIYKCSGEELLNIYKYGEGVRNERESIKGAKQSKQQRIKANNG